MKPSPSWRKYEEGFTGARNGIRDKLWASRDPETEGPLEAFLEHDAEGVAP